MGAHHNKQIISGDQIPPINQSDLKTAGGKIIKIQVNLLKQNEVHHVTHEYNKTKYSMLYRKITDTKLGLCVDVYEVSGPGLLSLADPEITSLMRQLNYLETALKSTCVEIAKLSSKIRTVEILQGLVQREDNTILTLIYTANTLEDKILNLKTTWHPCNVMFATRYSGILKVGQSAHISNVCIELNDITPSPKLPDPVLKSRECNMNLSIIYSHLQRKFVACQAVGAETGDGRAITDINGEDDTYELTTVETGIKSRVPFSSVTSRVPPSSII